MELKCNICGGEIPIGETVCKYCGNVVVVHKRKTEAPSQPEETAPQTHNNGIDTPVDAQVYQQNRSYGQFCTRCGRPLDGITHKCIVCDAAQVSKRAYVNDEFRNMEMDMMAQKKKKKKKTNTIRNIILAILGMIILFVITLMFAFGEFSTWLGIGEKDDKPAVTVTSQPKVTADPNWEADVKETPKKEEKTPEPTEEPTKAPARTPEPEPTGDPVEERGGEYLYPSDTHIITEGELNEMSRSEIKYIYWEIYARHGYTFDNELADYFENNHEWYLPTTSDEAKVEAKFNSIEKRNKQIIYDYQKKMGWR